MESKIKEYTERGHKVLKEKYWDFYDKVVPIRVKDLYHGMDIEACLEILEVYEEYKDLEKCCLKFDAQNHSGMSASIVASLIYNLHDEGDKIVRVLGFTCKDKEGEEHNE